MKIYILIMIFNYDHHTGISSFTQEFSNLKQCQYTYTILREQISKKSAIDFSAGGCFEK